MKQPYHRHGENYLMATGDAEVYIELSRQLAAHHGDREAWQRVGDQLAVQRRMLDRRYGSRALFARERQINPKTVYDVERAASGGRANFGLDAVLDMARAYGVAPESIGIVLDDDDGKIVLAYWQVPGAAARQDTPAPALASPPQVVVMSGVLDAETTAAAAPYATRILLRLRDLAADGIMRPSGRQVFEDFPDSDQDAARWDKYAGDLADDELTWLIAGLRARDAAAARDRDTHVGLRPHLPGPVTSRTRHA